MKLIKQFSIEYSGDENGNPVIKYVLDMDIDLLDGFYDWLVVNGEGFTSISKEAGEKFDAIEYLQKMLDYAKK